MALADAVEGGKRPSQTITWQDQDGNAFDLTGATITARIQNVSDQTVINSDGTFVVVTATSGIFRWDYGDNDVGTAGNFNVQFTATFGVNPTPARTKKHRWKVIEQI